MRHHFLKTVRRLSVFFLVLNFSCVPPQREVPEEPHTKVSFQVFYDDLSPYGHWINHPSRGYVWLPMDDPDFLPYSSHGHWVWTDYGWTWVSEYPWGWAPFHYGRWDFDPAFGWFWAPDNIWGPAWVVWSEYPGYYGWAPMRPGISITLVIGGGYIPPEPWWTFCERKYFGRHDMRDHFQPRGKIGRIRSGESRVIDNTFKGGGGNAIFLTGPGREDVQKTTGEAVERITIQNSNRPGETITGNTWSVYHPEIEQTPPSKSQPAPSAVMPTSDIPRIKQPEQKPSVTPLPTPRRDETKKPIHPRNIPEPQRAPSRKAPNVSVPKKEQPPQKAPRPDQAPKSEPKQTPK